MLIPTQHKFWEGQVYSECMGGKGSLVQGGLLDGWWAIEGNPQPQPVISSLQALAHIYDDTHKHT